MTGREFKSRIRALRLSQAEVARRLGLHPSTVWRWCAGREPVPQYAASWLEAEERAHALEVVRHLEEFRHWAD